MPKKYSESSFRKRTFAALINECRPRAARIKRIESIRRGVRVVEGARLESVYTRKGIAGSNPALSAQIKLGPGRGMLISGREVSLLNRAEGNKLDRREAPA